MNCTNEDNPGQRAQSMVGLFELKDKGNTKEVVQQVSKIKSHTCCAWSQFIGTDIPWVEKIIIRDATVEMGVGVNDVVLYFL